MTRDDIAPLGESEAFPCPRCGGGGLDPECGTATLARCLDCGGSGYGPPPSSLDHTKAHCLNRLAKWAQRAPQQEN